MNTWKKFASIGLAAVMAVSMAACGSNGAGGNAESGSDSGEAQKLTLILRAGAYGDSLKAALPAFEEEHNVECEVLELSFDDLHTNIALDAVNAEGAYDQMCIRDSPCTAQIAIRLLAADF